jgi:hypothetical protein
VFVEEPDPVVFDDSAAQFAEDVRRVAGVGDGFRTGLPDGIFAYQKSKFGCILEGLGMENVGIFYGYLISFVDIWCIVWPFGIFCGHLVYFVAVWYIFPRFGTLHKIKSGTPWFRTNLGRKFELSH